jgi:hypothetical protein
MASKNTAVYGIYPNQPMVERTNIGSLMSQMIDQLPR